MKHFSHTSLANVKSLKTPTTGHVSGNFYTHLVGWNMTVTFLLGALTILLELLHLYPIGPNHSTSRSLPCTETCTYKPRCS